MKKYQRRIDVTNSGIKYQGYTKDGFYFNIKINLIRS